MLRERHRASYTSLALFGSMFPMQVRDPPRLLSEQEFLQLGRFPNDSGHTLEAKTVEWK